jgi:hypothetical protein
MLGTIMMNTSITFYSTQAAAQDMADRNGGADEGYLVAPAKGRTGKFVIEVYDDEAGDHFFLGYL